jgi:hypothetical protein
MKMYKFYLFASVVVLSLCGCFSTKKSESEILNVDEVLKLNVLKTKATLGKITDVNSFPRSIPNDKKEWESL